MTHASTKKKPFTNDLTLEFDFKRALQNEPSVTVGIHENQQEEIKQASLKAFERQEIFEATKAYFDGDELAANVWINKYAMKDSQGRIYERSPTDMHQRLASELARIEEKYPHPLSRQEIYDLLKDFKYVVPQGGPMAGIGNDFQISSLSNCFVIGVGGESDSYGGILKLDEEQVQLMKRRGGVGHDLSHIRPKGSPVKNSALTSTGVVPIMERFSNTTREVAQDGRRGALMLSLSIQHPDAEDFIDAKIDTTKITGANISIKLEDDFMQAVEEDREYIQQFPIHQKNPISTRRINARKLWRNIIHNAWASAEPGVLFWDTIKKESVPDCYADLGYETVSTNPCGEIPLCPYDSCRLVAINLFSYVESPFTEKAHFNFQKFRAHAIKAQRIMDDIVDLEVEKIDTILSKIASDPEPEHIKMTERQLWEKIREKCVEGRRTGLGITAEGDMLAGLGMTYGSDEANLFASNIQKVLALSAYRSSVELAKERGGFNVYDPIREENNPFMQRLFKEDQDLKNEMKKYGRRNIACLTIAPTGSTSIMTQTTSGLEPVFMVSYKRRRKVNPNDQNAKIDFIDKSGDSWEEFHVLHHKFEMWLNLNGYSPEQVSKLDDAALQVIIEKSPYHGSSAADIDWLKKVEMQGMVQQWVDHSISVTINIPKETPEQVVENIYLAAWQHGCKGMTIYRDGSRDGVLISNSQGGLEKEFSESKAPKRPQKLSAGVVRFNNNDEKWIGVIGLLDDRPYEIFTGKAEDSFLLPNHVKKGWVIKNKNGDQKSRYNFQYEDRDGFKVTIEGLSRSFNPEYWNYAKLISGILRHGMPLIYIVNLIEHLHLSDESLNTWKNGVIRALSKFIADGTEPLENVCKECGDQALVYEEGCLNCHSCGYSRCG
ncbi:MAG: ribonucleoside-diphosphate reductase alpha chain [Cyclobacteriaceae bacterium]|jgi:ribonucleoside-diphosphate reductase alpha chain